LDAGRGLWQLSRAIVSDAGLKATVEQTPAEELIPELERSHRGRELLGQFRTYLDEFGWRSDAFELAERTWREDPRIPLNALQGYIRLGKDADPHIRFQEAVALRERLLGQARRKLTGNIETLRRFDQLYGMARHYLPITEDHNFHIDQRGNAVMRLALLEAGRRLAGQNRLEQPGDVFFLRYQDLHDALGGLDCRPVVTERRREIARWSSVLPPPVIGSPPPSGGDTSDPLIAALVKMFGIPIEPDRDPRVIRGIAASRGLAHGRARVVRNLSEASRLRKGDVLVCEMTMPAWTPLFSTVSALVADTGGVLSHCAIVSREYRLPAVVGTQIGTSVIKDGMLLTVDGTKGLVRIDEHVAQHSRTRRKPQ
jgi:pyruvate,water dikinase